MATKNYLDLTGFTRFWDKLKSQLKKVVSIQSKYITTTSVIQDNGTITSPLKYKVGYNTLTVYCLGERLQLYSSTQDGNYEEVGTKGATSSTIRLHNIGQTVPVGTVFEFVVRGGPYT